MRSLRRLSVVSLALIPAIVFPCSAGLHAQTPATPSFTQHVPPPNPSRFVVRVSPLFAMGQSDAPQQSAPAATFRLPALDLGTIQHLKPLGPPALSILARNESPCYMLRSYRFTTGHGPAEAPRLSSHTTCTPVSGTPLKEIVKTPSSH